MLFPCRGFVLFGWLFALCMFCSCMNSFLFFNTRWHCLNSREGKGRVKNVIPGSFFCWIYPKVPVLFRSLKRDISFVLSSYYICILETATVVINFEFCHLLSPHFCIYILTFKCHTCCLYLFFANSHVYVFMRNSIARAACGHYRQTSL